MQQVIFEGAELSGKSYLISQVFNRIEAKYNSGGQVLDGCHWFNCDVGLFGTAYGQVTLEKYLALFEALAGTNVLIEKFHFSEAVYQKLYHNRQTDFSALEKRLKNLGAKIVLVTFDEKEDLLKKRLEDRLRLYPHYAKIAQAPAAYIAQQRLHLELLSQSQLEHHIINASQLPNDQLGEEVLEFLGEK